MKATAKADRVRDLAERIFNLAYEIEFNGQNHQEKVKQLVEINLAEAVEDLKKEVLK